MRRFSPILFRYVLKEIFPPFVISIMFFTFIFLMAKILDITDLIVNYKISMIKIGMLLVYLMPNFLPYIIPMSVMIAVLLTILRLSSDNEIVALKANGISIYTLLPSIFVFCLIAFCANGVVSLYGESWGRMAFTRNIVKTVAANIDVGLEERTFNDKFEKTMLYVNKIDRNRKELHDVFIEDQRRANVVISIVAPLATFTKDPKTSDYQLTLYDGTIDQVDLDRKITRPSRFKEFHYRLPIDKGIMQQQNPSKNAKMMYPDELIQYLKNRKNHDEHWIEASINLHRRFSIPFACFILGLLSIPLGITSRSSKKSYGVVVGIFFFLFYYILLSLGMILSEAKKCSPFLGMWIPNIVVGIIAVYLFYGAVGEKDIGIKFLSALKQAIVSFFKRQ